MRFLASAFLVGLVICAPADAEKFVDSALGLSIEKPDDWQVISAEEDARSRTRIELESPELKQAIEEHRAPAVFAFMRRPDPNARMNARVKVETRPLPKGFRGQSGKQILEMMLPSMTNVVKGSKVIKSPEATTLAGKPAGHAALSYTLISSGKPLPVESEIWVIPRRTHVIIVGAGYRPGEETGDRAAVMKVVGSLELTD